MKGFSLNFVTSVLLRLYYSSKTKTGLRTNRGKFFKTISFTRLTIIYSLGMLAEFVQLWIMDLKCTFGRNISRGIEILLYFVSQLFSDFVGHLYIPTSFNIMLLAFLMSDSECKLYTRRKLYLRIQNFLPARAVQPAPAPVNPGPPRTPRTNQDVYVEDLV